MMSEKHLWMVEHPYYCSDSNYYHANELERYTSWNEFKDGYLDLDLNLLFRFDWKQRDDGINTLELFFVLQRKGIFRPVEVIVQKSDEDDIKTWLTHRWGHMSALWEGVTASYQTIIDQNNYLSSLINDLSLAVEMWLIGHEFDDEDPEKLRILCNRACAAIGKPRTMEELVEMQGFGDEYIELARQHDKDIQRSREEKRCQ